ncbi:hypothetical protein HJC23_009839 [Cyclotella cryptica]|uniref:Uncharacterized protein n=1 Tax=Cyclotella cryptica TaxID=29204 RepID=A0ABD3NU86_9STRA|eukprot:CCRYP_019925-RA/>CCRYP_019925-RA protein AED:0.47 eAED:0.47 QI:0/-1/0/1/-1/1/1/0/132
MSLDIDRKHYPQKTFCSEILTNLIMVRDLSVLLAFSLVVFAEGRQYYYAPLGPWGLESTVIHAKAMRNESNLKKVQNTSDGSKDAVEEVQDELEKAEEAFFHAVEEVEEKVVHAIDDEVETLFPHHKNSKEE